MLKQLWGSPNDETVMRTHKWLNSDGGHSNEDAFTMKQLRGRPKMMKQLRGRTNDETVMRTNYNDNTVIEEH